MKPIAIMQHAPSDGPGYFVAYADRHGLPWRLYRADVGDVPAGAGDFSGLVLMGGPMSAYDDLPWIAPVLELIRDAVQREVPVLGHCLGGQLLAKALGGEVARNPTKEIGWCELTVADNAEGAAWLGGDLRRFTAFEWHGDAFSLPAGATRLFSSPWCENQGFAMGPHLGLQCHVEMDAELVRSWCETGEEEIAAAGGPMVQSTAEIQRDVDARLASLHEIADRLYARWSQRLKT